MKNGHTVAYCTVTGSHTGTSPKARTSPRAGTHTLSISVVDAADDFAAAGDTAVAAAVAGNDAVDVHLASSSWDWVCYRKLGRTDIPVELHLAAGYFFPVVYPHGSRYHLRIRAMELGE